MPDYNYYPVEIERPENNNKNKKRLSQRQIKSLAVILLALILVGAGVFYIVDKIMNPVLIRVLVEPSLEYNYIYPFSDDLLYVIKEIDAYNGIYKWGVIDKYGEVAVPAVYDHIGHFHGNVANASQDNKWGVINTDGEILTPLIYNMISEFNDGAAIVSKDGKSGYIDIHGDLIIDLIYENAHIFSEGLAVVGQNGKYGAINKSGEIVIPFIYDFIGQFGEFKDGLMIFLKENKYGILDKDGNVFLPFEYNYISRVDWHEESYFYTDESIFIDLSGEIIAEIDTREYGSAGFLSEGLIAVRSHAEDKWGYISASTGEVTVDFIYDQANGFINGLAVVAKYETGSRRILKFGMIDTNGREIVLTEYDMIHYNPPVDDDSNPDGFILVSKGDNRTGRKFGIIDKEGDIIIPIIYDDAIWFDNGLAGAKKDGKTGVIDQAGNIVIDFIYDSVNIINKRLVSARTEDAKWGLINTKGDIILDFEYDWLFKDYYNRSDKLLCVRKDGLWGILEIK